MQTGVVVVPHGSSREIRNRTIGIVIAGAVLIGAVLLYGVTTLNKVRGIEAHWTTFSALTVKRDEQIHRIQQELGYGGFIHNFKNFMLRNDPAHLDDADQNLKHVREAIEILLKEDLSEVETAALATITTTVRDYEVRLVMADDAFADGMSSNQVDSLVIVDDRAALAALRTLSEASSTRLKQVQDETEQQLGSTIRFTALGLLAVPLILLVGFALYRSMLSLTRAHAAADAASRRLAGLLDTSPEAMIVADADGIIVQINRAATDMLDYEPGEPVGKPLTILIPKESQKQHRAKYEAFIKTPRQGVLSLEGSLYAVTKKGRQIPVEINLSVMEQDSDLLITAAIRDITLRLAYENALVEAREKAVATSDEKFRFLANMSHEIRTPINAVIGLSGLALKTGLNAKQLDYTRKIYSSGRRLLELVNDVLDFSKIESGTLDIDRTRFLLSAVMRDVAAMMAVRAEEKQVELILRVSPDVPDALIGDPLRLGQVLTNLVSNAVKFTEAGTVIVEGSVKFANAGTRALEFSVIDSGTGIPTDRLYRIFDAFIQADTSATRRFGGAGLGLTICKTIVDAMGGKIGVTSDLGIGSTFTFTVPLEEDPDAKAGGKTGARIDPRNTRVLVVDDNETACRIMAEELSALSFHVDTALSGNEAIQTLERASVAGTPYDLLLLDWEMPGMNGLETARHIDENPQIGAVPTILIVSAFSSDDARRLAIGLPIDAFLDKPLNTSSLINTLTNVLSHRGDTMSEEASVESSDAVLADAVKGKRVLVVEDNSINQQVAREILENEGLLVDTADNGRMALDLLFKQGPENYSAILMDVQMPEMDGISATRDIRADPSFNDVPIIALTAHALAEDRQCCLDVGMNDHLTKPVIANDLIAAMNTWIAGTAPRPAKPSPLPVVANASGTVSDVSDTPSNSAGVGEDMLTLPVLNLEKASSISRLSEDFLEELLCDFKDRYEGAAADIRNHLDKRERSEAQMIAHTVKGISGSLGAEQVFAAAIALDAGLKSDAADEVINPLYEEFAGSLATLLVYIEQNVVRPEAKA